MKQIKRFGIAFIVCVAPGCAAAQPVEDVQIWATQTATGSIKDEIVGYAEVQTRGVDNLGRIGLVQARGMIGYKVTPNLTVWAGYANLITIVENATDRVERRPYQQINLALGNILGGALSTRLRIEQRWFSGARDMGLRLRQQARWQRPLARSGPSLVLATEGFVNVNSTDWGARAGFDQVRGLIAINVPITREVTIEAGYNAIYVKMRPIDRLNHTIPITLTYRF